MLNKAVQSHIHKMGERSLICTVENVCPNLRAMFRYDSRVIFMRREILFPKEEKKEIQGKFSLQ